MIKFQFHGGAVALAILVASSAALAQSPAHDSSTTSTISNAVSEVKHWTWKKWKQARHEWKKDKAKWEGCNQKATDQKLSGRASWSFIYTCMTTS